MSNPPTRSRAGLRVGQRLAERYEVLAVLGSGGQGSVYRARDLRGGPDVALKVLDAAPGLAEDDLRAELGALRVLDHAGVVALLEVLPGIAGSGPVLVLEALSGRGLAEAFAEADDRGRDLLATRLVAAVAYLHARGLVHGDLKPANVLVRETDSGPWPVLIDFGMAVRRGLESFRGGTPAYLAPEVREGGRPTTRSDVFALGVTLLQVLTGRARPRRTVPPGFETTALLGRLVPRMLRPDPLARPRDAGALLAMVETLGRGDDAIVLPPLLPFVGRRDVLAHLLAVIADPGGQHAVVRGVEGSGRRRCLRELALRATEQGVAVATAGPGDDLRAVLRRLAAALGAGADDRGDAVLEAGPVALGTRVDRAGAWLAERCRGRRLVLALDATRPLDREVARLRAQIAASGPEGLLLIVAAGDEAAAEDGVVRVGLEPLRPADVRRLLTEVLDVGRGTEELGRAARWIAETSGGRPAVVEQLLRAAVASGAFRRDGGEVVIDLAVLRRIPPEPDAVRREALRLDRLDPAERALLGVAALGRAPLPRSTLARVLEPEPPDLERLVDRLLRAGLLVVDADDPLALRFARRETAVAAAATLASGEARRLHRRYARVEHRPHLRLAHRLDAGDRPRDEDLAALEALMRAGDSAAAAELAARARGDAADWRWTLVEARCRHAIGEDGRVEALVSSLESDDRPEARVAGCVLSAHRAVSAGDLDAALDRAEAAVESAAGGGAGPLAEVRALSTLADVHLRRGDLAACRRAADAALLRRDVPEAERALALNVLGLAAVREGDLDAAAVGLERACAAFEGGGERVAAALVANNLGHVLTRQGAWRAARRRLVEAIGVFSRGGCRVLRAQALTNLAILEGEGGSGPASVSLHRQALALYEAGGDRSRARAARASIGMALGLADRPVQAARVLRAALRELEGSGAARAALLVRAHLARAEARSGRGRCARRTAARALRAARGLTAPRERVEALAAAAEAALARHPVRALRLGRRAVASARAAGDPSLGHLARATLLRVAVEADREVAARLLAEAAEPPLRFAAAHHAAAARLAPALDVRRHVARGLRAARRRGAAAVRLELWLRAADAALQLGDPPRARRALDRFRRDLSGMENEMTTRESAFFRLNVAAAELEHMATRLRQQVGEPVAEALGSPRPVAEILGLLGELASETRMDALLLRVLEASFRLTAARRGFVVLREGPEDLAFEVSLGRDGRPVATPEDHVSLSLVHQVLATGRVLVVDDARGSADFGGLHSVIRHGLHAIACAPIALEGRRLGVLYLDGGERRGAFSDAEVPVLEGLGRIAAVAIRNLRHRQRSQDERRAMAQELDSQRAEITAHREDALRRRREAGEGDLVGRSSAIVAVNDLVHKVAPTDLSCLVLGESGVGKELVARALHDRSERAGAPFVPVNCAALPPQLFESELFGHVRGAFTGAGRRDGLFVQAARGTLFLDEVTELPLEVQGKLLRVLQEGEVRPLGSDRAVRCRPRIVAATNRDLAAMVEAGSFRDDLYFRLKGVVVAIPPLRDRPEDVPPLVDHFLGAVAPGHRVARKALRILCHHAWPGNVRELRAEVERAALLAEDALIRPDDLSPALRSAGEASPFRAADGRPLELKEIEVLALQAALRETGGDRKAAAALLGISRSTLYEKLKKLPG